ncbi:MAG: diphthine--ammonia ligase [Filifactor alocis]|nr:diphthine--ammonia ligase [Filifactor alocis]
MYKAVVSYSGGKDSILALERAIAQGYRIEALLVTLDVRTGRSFFHNLPLGLLKEVGRCLELPLKTVDSKGEDYRERFAAVLKEFKRSGTEACVFGDIDIEEHRSWCRSLCDEVGLKAVFPLWGEEREELVGEVVSKGYCCVLQKVRKSCFDKEVLGSPLTQELIEEMRAKNIDVCGENGEYHTFVVDGPLFRSKLTYTVAGVQESEDTFSLVLKEKKEENFQ